MLKRTHVYYRNYSGNRNEVRDLLPRLVGREEEARHQREPASLTSAARKEATLGDLRNLHGRRFLGPDDRGSTGVCAAVGGSRSGRARRRAVIDQDRRTRSPKAVERAIYDTFRRADCKLATPSDTIDLASVEQSLGADIISSVAAYERWKFLARSARGKREKMRQGKFRRGKDPYGYRWTSDGYEIVEREEAVVRRMFNLALRLGTNMVEWTLNEEGHRSRARKLWRKSSARRYR